jgi:hypothetical protein
MLRSLTVAVTLTLAATSSLAAERLSVQGDPAKRWIADDDLGFYYDIPMGEELRVEIEGPGTLIMFLVNHEATGTRGNSVLVVTRDKKAWKRLKLGCAATPKRFVDETDIKPCERVTRDLQIEPGTHHLGFRLKRTRVGASVHFLFASRERLDLEPELATAVADSDSELSWEEAEELDLLAPPTAVGESGPAPTGISGKLANPWLWTAAGVGVAAGATGIAFGLMSSSDFSDAENRTTSQRDWQDLNDSGKQKAVVANVLFATAAAGLAGAAVLYYFDIGTPAAPPEAEAGGDNAWTVVPRTGPDGWGVDACVQF